MFLKAALTFLVVGALSVNAFSIPGFKSPAPKREFRPSFSITTYHDLTLASFNSHRAPSFTQ